MAGPSSKSPSRRSRDSAGDEGLHRRGRRAACRLHDLQRREPFRRPEYTRTPSYLEPDSTLIEKLAEPTDLVSVDTAAADSIEQLEKEEAKKVYNSIRRPQHNEEDEEAEASSETSSEGEASSSDDAASTAPSSAPSPSVSAPKVEAIGNE